MLNKTYLSNKIYGDDILTYKQGFPLNSTHSYETREQSYAYHTYRLSMLQYRITNTAW